MAKTSMRPPNHFSPYDAATQPAPLVPAYKETLTRNPAQPLIARPATLTEITGPTQLARKLPTGMRDLSRKNPDGPRAMGQLILVRGRLLDEDGQAVRNSVIELWHANSAGRYLHPMDAQSPAPLDENFLGSGRVLTDDAGHYEFITVKPGAYPVPNHPKRWWRPPHIHISVFGEGFMSRLVTQMFFPGDPLNEVDLILNAVPDAKGRERMVSRQIAMLDMPMLNLVGYEHDIVVRGDRQTPFGK
jgi:protocatechuate 3,4-dioxygenase beta subunit